MWERVGAAHRLAGVDARAAARGLAQGVSLADARARVPDLVFVERDHDGEAATLEAIAEWCDRFTPLVAHDRDFEGAAGLLLDVTGVAHLFGGEEALATRVVADLRTRGFSVRVAIAGTAGAARAVARYGLEEASDAADGVIERGADVANRRVVAPGRDEEAVAGLSVKAIDPDGERAARLSRLGLATVSALLEMPRAALARRFGADLLLRLDEAVGRVERPISPRRPVAALTAERAFLEPILSREDIAEVVRSLAVGLGEALERRGEGLRAAELALWRVDGEVRRITIGTGRALRDPDRVVALFAERLKGVGEEIEIGFGIDLVRLSVTATAQIEAAQVDFSGDTAADEAFEHLVDRLGARLGGRRITRFLPGEAHLPEAAAISVPAASSEGRAAAARWSALALEDGIRATMSEVSSGAFGPSEAGRLRGERERPASSEPNEGASVVVGGFVEPPVRPIRLFARPEPIDTVAELPDGPPVRFRWRRVLHEVDRAEGPERIACEWWRLPIGLGPEGAALLDDGMPLLGGGVPREAEGGAIAGLDDPWRGEGRPEARLDRRAATRDYFRVEDTEGRRFWIFRVGLFGRETVRPQWFLHGLFA